MLYKSQNPHGGDIYGGQVKLDFSANTNPFGTPKGVLDAVQAALPQMHRYPDPYCRKLVKAISQHEYVPESYILCGNGAADLIYAYCEAVHPKTAGILAPTFSEYALALGKIGCSPWQYVLNEENGFAITEDFLSWIRENRPEAVFLCNPNNPTGTLMDEKLMERIIDTTRELKIHLFVDECFLDLSQGGKSVRSRLKENHQLFLLKAFTKSYGMAGIRLGYCLSGNEKLLSAMAKASQPWNVSTLAQAAGVAALEEVDFLRKTREMVFSQREIMKAQLKTLGFRVSDSRANYILFRGPLGLREKLEEKKIAIRSCANYAGLGEDYYRVAVRLPEENRTLMDAIRECLKEGD